MMFSKVLKLKRRHSSRMQNMVENKNFKMTTVDNELLKNMKINQLLYFDKIQRRPKRIWLVLNKIYSGTFISKRCVY